jgi:hypothetical protein
MKGICKKCGRVTDKDHYHLCAYCYELSMMGVINQCRNCNDYYSEEERCKCGNSEGSRYIEGRFGNECLICEKEIPDHHYLCRMHFNARSLIEASLKGDHLDSVENYIRLYNFAYEQGLNAKSDDEFEESKLTLFTISEILMNDLNNDYLDNRILDDLSSLDKGYYDLPFEDDIDFEFDLDLDDDFFSSWEMDEEIIDPRKRYGTPDLRCNDGHYVRSKGEKMLDNFLYEKRIIHSYEDKVYDGSDEFLCDFYLPDIAKHLGGVYIEYFGLNNDEYLVKKEKKIHFYKRNNMNLIIIEEKHMQNLEDYLDDQIRKLKMK